MTTLSRFAAWALVIVAALTPALAAAQATADDEWAAASHRTSRSAEIGHGQPVACLPSCVPVLGDPNVVGVPVIVGTPFWVYWHVSVLCGVESGADGSESVGKGVSVRAGADAFGLRA